MRGIAVTRLRQRLWRTLPDRYSRLAQSAMTFRNLHERRTKASDRTASGTILFGWKIREARVLVVAGAERLELTTLGFGDRYPIFNALITFNFFLTTLLNAPYARLALGADVTWDVTRGYGSTASNSRNQP
jgi:hypothetical protein